MAAIKVKPVRRVQGQSYTPSRNETLKKSTKRNLFGAPKPGETDAVYKQEEAHNYERLLRYEFIPSRVDSDSGVRTIKRSGSPLITDHFKIKKVCKTNLQLTLMTTKEKLSDAEQCTLKICEIGSTNFVRNLSASDPALEEDATCTDDKPLPPATHQQIKEQSQEEVLLHRKVTNHAGKFS